MIVSLAAAVCQAESVSLSKLDLCKIQQARGPRGGLRGARPTNPVPISIAGQAFEDGVKTFGSSTLWIDLGQKATRFTALVGIDDEAKAATGTATFRVYGDAKDGMLEVWAKKMEDGSKAVGLFNRSEFEATVKAAWQTLGLGGKQKVRDLWRQKDLGEFTDQFEAKVPRHGVVLVRISPAR